MRKVICFILVTLLLTVGIVTGLGEKAYAKLEWDDRTIVDKWAWAETIGKVVYSVNTKAGSRATFDLKLKLYDCSGDFVTTAWVVDVTNESNTYQYIYWSDADTIGTITANHTRTLFVIGNCSAGRDKIKKQRAKSEGDSEWRNNGSENTKSSNRTNSNTTDNCDYGRSLPSGGVNMGLSAITVSDYEWENGGLSAGIRFAKVINSKNYQKAYIFIGIDASYEMYKGTVENSYECLSFYNLDPIIGITTSRARSVYWNILELAFPIPGISVAELESENEKITKVGAQFSFGTSWGFAVTDRSSFVVGLQYKANLALENFENTNKNLGSDRFVTFIRLAFF